MHHPSLSIHTRYNSLTTARELQRDRLASLETYAATLPSAPQRDLTRALATVQQCGNQLLASEPHPERLALHRLGYCRDHQLCLPCAVYREWKLSDTRAKLYRRMHRAGYRSACLLTVTARHRKDDDPFRTRHAVKEQTNAILKSLKKHSLIVASDTAPEVEPGVYGLHYHMHNILWLNDDASVDIVRDISLKSRLKTLDRIEPRTDGLPWVECLDSQEWCKPIDDPRKLASYLTKTAHRIADSGDDWDAYTLHEAKLLMSDERTWRPSGLLRELASMDALPPIRLHRAA